MFILKDSNSKKLLEIRIQKLCYIGIQNTVTLTCGYVWGCTVLGWESEKGICNWKFFKYHGLWGYCGCVCLVV